jgi:cyclase
VNSLRPRVIPCLQFADRELLKTRRFRDPVYLGDPINSVKIFNDLDCDELIVVDIRATLDQREPDYAMIEEFASEAFMPLAYGGGINSVEQVRRILSIGIEKVVISTAAAGGKLISAAAAVFGSQSIVVSIDVQRSPAGRYAVWTRSGTHDTGSEARAYAAQMEGHGAGELIVQSIDREGTRNGYDLTLMKEISSTVKIPVIASGGAGSLEDIRQLLRSSRVAGAAAGTMFVLHGKHDAPLISYPPPDMIASLIGSRTSPAQ